MNKIKQWVDWSKIDQHKYLLLLNLINVQRVRVSPEDFSWFAACKKKLDFYQTLQTRAGVRRSFARRATRDRVMRGYNTKTR